MEHPISGNLRLTARPNTYDSEAAEELDRMYTLLNTPELEDFAEAVKREAAHQIDRWGEHHDKHKEPQDWFWLIGYLSGKALRANIDGDLEKAKHHTISSAAALLNWHRHIKKEDAGRALRRHTGDL